MAYKPKYHPGEKITSLDELEKQEFIYCNGKIMHEGWFKSWPFRLASNYIKWGSLRYAVKIEMEDNMQIKIEKAGVTKVNYDGFYVNNDDMVQLVESEIDKMNPKPKMDYDAKFAAKVTITVEFLGDMEE